MATKALFTYLPGSAPRSNSSVSVLVDGVAVPISPASSLAAGLLAAGITAVRVSPVGGEQRAPYCMMGVCFECLVEVDGKPNQQACLITPENGMEVRTLQSAPCLVPTQEAKHA